MSNLVIHSLSSSNGLKRELIQGEEYRKLKRNNDIVIQPVCSPVDISFFVHRKRYVRKVEENIKIKKSGSIGKHASSNFAKRKRKTKSLPHIIKHTFWERAKLTHKQYTNILSTPHLYGCGDSQDLRKYYSHTFTNICSPRLAQMAYPNKRRILGVWQEYGHKLPTDALQRLHDMLYTNQSIDMKEARNFFKLCDKKKRKLARKKKLRKKKKKKQKEVTWLRNQLEDTSAAILKHFSTEPTLETSFKQLLISDVLLSVLGQFTKCRQPILRYSSNLYDKALVKMVDKIAVWTDTISKIVEIQGLELDDDEEKGISKISEESSSIASTVTLSELDQAEGVIEGAGDLETGEGVEEGDEEDEGMEGVGSLQRLIQILANASPGYLSDKVEYEDMTRNELLHRMKILNKNYIGKTPADIMKSILLDWAMHNDPDKVDDEIIEKINKISEILVAMVEAEETYGMMGLQPEGEKVGEPADKPAEPEPGTLTEIKGPDGSAQMGVVDDNGDITPVQVTPSGNLIPTVYDKGGKVVNKLFDKEENLLDSTFNKYGVPEPDKYNGELFDDEKKPHELIFNQKGNIIPQCYDKDGNPIAADYDSNGNPINFGDDGKPMPTEPVVKDDQPAAEEEKAEKEEEKEIEPEKKDEEEVKEEEKKEEQKPDEIKDEEKGAEEKVEEAKEDDKKEEKEGEQEKQEEVKTEEKKEDEINEDEEVEKEKEAMAKEKEETNITVEEQGKEKDEEVKVEEQEVVKDEEKEVADKQEEEKDAVDQEEVKQVEEEQPEDEEVAEEPEQEEEEEQEEEQEVEEESEKKVMEESIQEGESEEEEELEEEESEEPESSSIKSEEEEDKTKKERDEGLSPSGSRESMVTVIKGHKPRKVLEHSKDTVCCLSLKIWAVWLLEITHNAHNWTKWISNIISQIREFAAILRGDILLPNGQKKVMFKEDWNKFVEDMNEEVIAWRQYSRHINDLTKKIIEKFHGRKVHCCEKCLQDHLIKNAVAAHDTMRALTEALNCTGYWQRCLDEIVQATTKLFAVQPNAEESSSDGATGWSYSSSSEDDDDNPQLEKKIGGIPLSTWKYPTPTPRPCQCKVKQLFPR